MTQDETPLLKEIEQGVAVLSFNRPDRANSWSIPMERAYFAELQACAEDPEVRVIVVTGRGKCFCPGMEAERLVDQADGTMDTKPHLRTPMTLPRRIPKPVIAAINGPCAGIGLVTALNCDLRFASSTAKITTAFAHRGIAAEQGIAWTLPREVGVSQALDLLFSARVVQGDEALRLGIVNRIFEPADLMPKTLEYARNLATHSSPIVMGTAKRLVYEAQESTHEEARLLALRYWLGVVRDHPDFKEGITSYVEKRPPRFLPWDPALSDTPPPLPVD